jgi:hypothetical protein
MREERKSAGDWGQESGRDRHQAVTHEKEEKKRPLRTSQKTRGSESESGGTMAALVRCKAH